MILFMVSLDTGLIENSLLTEFLLLLFYFVEKQIFW